MYCKQESIIKCKPVYLKCFLHKGAFYKGKDGLMPSLSIGCFIPNSSNIDYMSAWQ